MPPWLIGTSLALFLLIVFAGYFYLRNRLRFPLRWSWLAVLLGAAVIGASVWGSSYADSVYLMVFLGVFTLAPWLTFAVITCGRTLRRDEPAPKFGGQ